MNIQSKKLLLIEWITALHDSKVLDKLIALQKSKVEDWADKISIDEQEDLEIGLKDFEEGNVIPHSEVKKLYGKFL